MHEASTTCLSPLVMIRFMRIFAEQYEAHYKTRYEAAGIYYEHRLIDDMVAQVSQGLGIYGDL